MIKIQSFVAVVVAFCPVVVSSCRTLTLRSSIMENHSTARVVLMLFGFLNILVAMMFNLLSRFGSKSGECLSERLNLSESVVDLVYK